MPTQSGRQGDGHKLTTGATEEQLEYFPENALEAGYPGSHAFRVDWYVPHLLSMEEKPLFPPAPDQPDTYRLLFLPTFHRPVVVRIIKANETWRLVCKRSDGRGGYDPGPLIYENMRALSSDETRQFGELLSEVKFWDMPSIDQGAGVDGSQAVLEGICEGQYHVVDRWSPHGTTYATLVEFLLSFCPSYDDQPN